jgi:hypothetical protein
MSIKAMGVMSSDVQRPMAMTDEFHVKYSRYRGQLGSC